MKSESWHGEQTNKSKQISPSYLVSQRHAFSQNNT